MRDNTTTQIMFPLQNEVNGPLINGQIGERENQVPSFEWAHSSSRFESRTTADIHPLSRVVFGN